MSRSGFTGGLDGYILITELPKVDIVPFLKRITSSDRHGKFFGSCFLMQIEEMPAAMQCSPASVPLFR